jgi:hypothetical protein
MSRYFPRRFFALAFSYGLVCCGLGACSIHPLPKDVTGYDTAKIVRKIRCEAQGAIRKAALEILHKHRRHEEITEVTDQKSLHRVSLTSWEASRISDLERIGIVYDFSLQGVESEGLMLSGELIKPLRNGSETFSPSLGDSLKRDNTRNFTISDSFTTLLNLGSGKDGEDLHCQFQSSDPNYAYPIVGRIGLDEMIQTFVRLTVSGDLVAPEDLSPPPSGGITLTPAGPPTMVDNLIFTTTISAGLTPAITLMPAGMALQLENASLAGTAMRTDTHTVTIGMALGKPSATPSAPAITAILPGKTTALFLTPHAKQAGLGEQLAAQAVAQYYIRRDLRRASFAIGTP